MALSQSVKFFPQVTRPQNTTIYAFEPGSTLLVTRLMIYVNRMSQFRPPSPELRLPKPLSPRTQAHGLA
jgi:hypothetical protein